MLSLQKFKHHMKAWSTYCLKLRSILPIFLTAILLPVSPVLRAQNGSHYYFVFLNANKGAAPVTDAEMNTIRVGHHAGIDSLYRSGSLVAAGPFKEGGGMLLLKAASEEEAWTMVDNDPEVKTGRLVADLYPFVVQKGSFCHAGDPFRLKDYTFIEFHRSGPVCKLEPETLEFLYQQHQAYLDTLSLAGHVLLDGTLVPYEGKVMILDVTSGDMLKAITSGSPFSGIEDYIMIVRTLDAGQDEFCETQSR
jgi:uncharacterized protein YciI